VLPILLFGALLLSRPAQAQEESRNFYKPTTGDYGNVGILATRTARFYDDGTLSVNATWLDPYRRYAVTFQALPFLEATFRYTQILNRDFSLGGLASEESFQDRGADLKLKLWNERRWLPQVAVGLQDGLGTGLFSGEFLVASKRYYDFDFSLGVGWGLLGAAGEITNPLCELAETFCTRTNTGGVGGTANLGTLFSGPTVGLFGGVQWHTPVRGLILSMEVDGNDYRDDPLTNDLLASSRLNFGITYRPAKWLELTGAFERGNTAMFRATLKSNLKDLGVPKFDSPPPELKPRPKPKPIEQSDPTEARLAGLQALPSERPRLPQLRLPGDPVPIPPRRRRAVATVPSTPRPLPVEPSPVDSVALADALFDGLEKQGLIIEGVETKAETLTVSLSQGLSEASDRDIARAFEVVSGTLPQTADRITLVEQVQGRVTRRVSMRRNEIEQMAIVDYLFDGLEAQGFAVDGVELTHREVALMVSEAPPDDDGGEQRAALIAFQTLPVPIERVAIVRVQEGRELSRVLLRRGDVRRAARIDQMFDSLEATGFAVESLELARDDATVYVTATQPVTAPDYREAAELVAQLAPEPVNSIVVVGLSAGVESERVTLRRERNGTASGGEREFVPDLTDNEKREIALKVFEELEAEAFRVDAFRITRHRATVFVTPRLFRQYARNVGWAARIVANNAPASVEEIEVVTMSAGLETGRVTVMRRDLERAVAGDGSPEEIHANALIPGPSAGLPPFGTVPRDAINNPRRYPSFNLYIRPALRQHIGGPDAFWLYQIWLAISAEVELYRGLTVSGTLGRNIVSTLDEITLETDSQLPPVRSLIKEYLQQGDDGNIVHLHTQYMFQPVKNWYARVAAGLLEEMYGGVGAEVLYRPFGSRLAVGADVFRVRQRAFDQQFDFRAYRVTTGHLNVYYKVPWLRLLLETHAGQFLAGDRGGQFVVSRSFDSGFQFGAWATFTNVPFEVFGEGSFDKGFYVRVPFELFMTKSSRRSGVFAFRPLTRDGGQMAGRTKELYGIVEEGNYDNVMRDWDRFLD